MGLVIAILGGAVVMGLLWMVLRPRGAAGSAGSSTRIGDDGFFVQGDFPDGAQVEYEALVNGTWRRGMAAVSGRETFVYTGTPPTEVRILGVIGGGVTSSVPSSAGVLNAIASNDDDDEPFAGTPSAY